MARTEIEISEDISTRLMTNEFIPEYISTDYDYKIISDAVGDFLAPYILLYENLLDIYNDQNSLINFLEKRGMFLNGSETLTELQEIASNRLSILSRRGTVKMIDEVKRIVNESTETNLQYSEPGGTGWVCGLCSPCYTTSSSVTNLAYLGLKRVLVFNLKNLSGLNNSEIKKKIRKYFMPVHMVSFINFIEE